MCRLLLSESLNKSESSKDGGCHGLREDDRKMECNVTRKDGEEKSDGDGGFDYSKDVDE